MSFTIKEISEQVGISAYTLRYYEKEGIIPVVKRDTNGNRIYYNCDIQWLEMVNCLRETGMTLSDIRKIVQLSQNENCQENLKKRMKILLEHKNMVINNIKEMQKHLAKIEKKIAYYEGRIDSC